MAFDIIITTAGRAALVNAANTGTLPVLITQIGVSSTAISANPGMVALTGELKRLSTISGEVVADDTIHVTLRDESADAYGLRAVGLYLADGTLFALYGQATPILEKTPASVALLAIDIIFADISAASISFGDTDFTNPPATETVQGVAEIATQAEVNSGTDNTRIVTPLRLAQRLAAALPGQATETLMGVAEIATQAEVTAGTDNARIVTPLRLAAALAPVNQNIANEATARAAAIATETNARTAADASLGNNLAALIARTITGGGLATGGGSLAENRVISVAAANVAQLLAGTANNVALTPGVLGPIVKSFNQNGYIALALGDPANALCIQWGRATAFANGTTSVNFPVAFGQAFSVVADGTSDNNTNRQDNFPAVLVNSITQIGFQLFNANDIADLVNFIAIGRIDLT